MSQPEHPASTSVAAQDSVGRSALADGSERQRAEREQALLAAIVQSSDDAIVSISPIAPEFRAMTWNKGAERLFGFSAEEAIGRSIIDLYVPPEDRDEVIALIQHDAAAFQQNPEIVRRLEVQARRKDGTRIAVSLVVSGIYDGAGKLLGMSNIIRDITERERAEREQAMLAAIVGGSEDAIVGVSLDNTITSWNRGAERLFGVTATEAIGRNPLEFVRPEEHPRVGAAVKELSRTGKPVSFQLHSISKDGTSFDSWVNLFPIYDSSGRISAVGAIGRDVTELLRLEREQASLATIVDASEDAVIAVSSEMRIVSWSRGAEKIYGRTAEQAIGHGFDSFLAREQVPAVIALTKHIFETGEPATWEQVLPGKDVTKFLSVSVFPIRDPEGHIVEVAGIGRDITKLKQIETELRAAHEYTRGLIDSSIDPMVVVDPDMRISDGNEQLARLTELPKKVLFGSRFDGHFSDPLRARAAVEKVLADGCVTNVDLTLKAASGREILISFNASLFYRAGKVFGIFGVARDVTEQRAMERTLREEREYSRSLVQSSPDALLVSDSNLILTDVNERALELTRYDREELIGSKAASLFTDPIRALEVLEKSRDEGFVHDIEFFLLTRNADEIPISLNASALKDADGRNRRIVVAMRDVTESKRAQKANSLVASIVDSSADAICSETVDMIITSWNPAAERLFGYSAAEAVGRSVALLVPLDRRAELGEQIRRIRRERKTERYETVRLRKDGSAVEVAVTQSPILDSAGELIALSVTVRDISDRRRMEAELTRTRDAALEAARLKSEFLANMSHEIRTPLNSIIGMTGLLLDTELTTEQREFAHDVRESSETLLSLISNILDFSKLTAGKLVLEDVDFDLTNALEGVVELVTDQARRKGLELTVSVEPEVPRFLRGDPGRLRQVLLNLLANAVKFTDHGEVSVQVSKLSENPKEAMLRFEVRDTGIGIPAEKQHLLFQPFTQVDASTTRLFGGTGLGLSIARELVEAMHGTIAVSSAPGAGSTFWFTVTLTKQVDVTKPASERFASMSGARILIVDDNPNSRQVLDRQVSSWGMKSSTAASAEEALAMMRGAAGTEPYLVVLLDVMMPDVDGIELVRMIKSEPALARTAIIFISSVGSSNDFRARLKGLDISGWLMKPVPESSLYNALVKALEPSGLGAARDRAAQEPAAIGKLKLPANRKCRVLVVEDNPINQKVARLQLLKLGLEVDAVANGREAVEALSRVPYDVVLMDCQMPDMDGYGATREIRRREGPSRHTPIVAMTAHALSGDREKCLAAGMDGYVSKPVTFEALESELAGVLAKWPSAVAAQAPATVAPAGNGAGAVPAREFQPAAQNEPGDGHSRDAGRTVAPVAAPAVTSAQSGSAAAIRGGRAAGEICDRETIDSLRLEGVNFLRELVELFKAEAPKGVRELAQALDEADPARATVIAHTLKGTAGTFGATRMQALAAAIEQAACAGSVEKAILEELRCECERVREVLEAEASSPPA